ncbi:hypothetical protein ALO95_05596 [Pseudomonas syringae pv. antirrhini]|uniref:Uncharacterized protein n=1 Tax=Pseudomonas syringae pv. antirrhini TaxID=251702 RepID=A0A0N8QNI7_9PSED|nr:Unknown protein sequence [Pseudomonas syringae pv. antirrhini]RMP40441.1 hypothetical protein ALQ23_05586 [Pseudomonas syringae pv. antirrhini]RMW29586.1 hypothetical protein ALO95_05596 [Pseudomonas syringae pv. antirrhini]
MLTQGLCHDAESPGQQVHFGSRGNGQRDLVITFANAVGSLGQRFDRCTKATGNTVRGHKADAQHRQPDQPQKARDPQRTISGIDLGAADVFQRLAVHIQQAVTQAVKAFTQLRIATYASRVGAELFQGIDKSPVIDPGPLKPVAHILLRVLRRSFLQQLLELTLNLFQLGRVAVDPGHQHQLVAQVLTQLQAQIQNGEVVLNQRFLRARHLHDADEPQQQSEQGDCDQRRNAQKEASAQLHGQFHLRSFIGCTVCVCGKALKHRYLASWRPDPGFRWSPARHRCALFPARPDSERHRRAARCSPVARPCPDG